MPLNTIKTTRVRTLDEDDLQSCYFFSLIDDYRYPKAVMMEIAELAKGLGSTYLDKQKSMLQRTFVKASDAAQSKVKRKHLHLFQQFFLIIRREKLKQLKFNYAVSRTENPSKYQSGTS